MMEAEKVPKPLNLLLFDTADNW